jgi:3-hydroxy-9,10-secoandrosta-1,3,5(10)-triene-9,17-dione monooxygenase reductase component
MRLSADRRRCTELDARSFRDALGRFATGVAFIAATPAGEPAGLIVNSLTSVSLEPPLMAFCPSRDSLTWARMRGAGRFGISILARRHERFVRRAAAPGADRFAGVELAGGAVPLLADALAWLEGEIAAEHPAGDHTIVVLRISDVRVKPVDEPLAFFDGRFWGLGSQSGHS